MHSNPPHADGRDGAGGADDKRDNHLTEWQFGAAMEQSAIGTALVSLDGRWLQTNLALQRMLGYEAVELAELTFQDVTHPDDLAGDLAHVEQLLAGEARAYQMDKRYIRKDGSEIWISLSVSMVKDADGRPQYFISQVQDITERRAADLERRRLAAQANAANEAKSQFLASMSHEIRTPLNGVLGMAQAMALHPLPDDQRARLDVLRESGESLLAILNDILDLSKVEAGQLAIEAVDFDLSRLLASAHSTFACIARDKGLSFILNLGNATGVYHSDPTRLRQVISNLITNALKFTTQGSVRVSASLHETGLDIQVSDTGIGIAADALASIFNKFTQADASIARTHGGTGLGLSISRELARLLGGEIQVESRQGEGSTFTLRLPIQPIGHHLDAVTPHLQAPQRRADLKVLVAEDNPTNQIVLKALLGPLGIAPVVVSDGKEAVTAWRDSDWDVILMDVQMPVVDGIAATRCIREQETLTRRRRTPIIALTANAMTHHVEDYARAGMDAFVSKPIDVRALLAALDQVLGTPGAEVLVMPRQAALR